MFFHAANSSINVQHIESMEWGFIIDNNGKCHDVVSVYTLGGFERLYLYYSSPRDREATARLKNLVNYPHPLPLLDEAINKNA